MNLNSLLNALLLKPVMRNEQEIFQIEISSVPQIIGMQTFITEMFRLVSNVQLVNVFYCEVLG